LHRFPSPKKDEGRLVRPSFFIASPAQLER
jgi:hypothetical protein